MLYMQNNKNIPNDLKIYQKYCISLSFYAISEKSQGNKNKNPIFFHNIEQKIDFLRKCPRHCASTLPEFYRRQHLWFSSSADSIRLDGGAAQKKKTKTKKKEKKKEEHRRERRQNDAYVYIEPLFMIVGPLKREGRVEGSRLEKSHFQDAHASTMTRI